MLVKLIKRLEMEIQAMSDCDTKYELKKLVGQSISMLKYEHIKMGNLMVREYKSIVIEKNT